MSEPSMGGFAALDWVVLAAYFLIIVITGIIFTKRQRSTDDYFLANRSIPMFAAAISFLATSLSAATFVGGPQQSYAGDLTYLSSNIGSILAIIIVAVFFIPVLYKQEVATVYGLLESRFGKPSSLSASGAFMIGRIFASGARLYIAALPASLIIYGDIAIRHQLVAIALLTVVGIAYTYLGGIRTVIWTDVIQTVIFVSAAIVAVVILYKRIPLDFAGIVDALRNPGEGAASKLTLFKLGTDGFGPKNSFTLLTAIFGFSLLSLGAYGTDQDMAQRLMTCKNAVKGSRSAITGVLIGIPVTTLFMLLGWLLYIFYSRPELMGAVAPAYEVESSRKIFLSFILRELPPGVTGLMMAGLFAAGLSSLNSAINAMSSSFVNDLYKHVKPNKSDKHYLKTGRLAVLVFGIVLGLFAVSSVFWQEARPETTLINFALMVMVFAYSGLVGVFLSALFTKRGNNVSVIAALITGFLSVLVMQTWFADDLAFPWQMFIATVLSFTICQTGSPEKEHGVQCQTKKSMKLSILILTINRADLLRGLMDVLIKQLDNIHKILIIDNGHQKLQYSSEKIEIIINPVNSGVAKGWNQGLIELFINDTSDAVLVLNDDIVLKNNHISSILEILQDDKHFFFTGPFDWAVWLIKRECWELTKDGDDKVLDEKFEIAFYEDTDYERRLKLAFPEKIKLGISELSPRLAHRSMSVHKNKDIASMVSHQFGINQQYYIRKWGGDKSQETYLTPFGNYSDRSRNTKSFIARQSGTIKGKSGDQ